MRKLLVWSLVVGLLGTFLAYNGPVSSAAWRYWGSNDAWLKDSVRLLLFFLTAYVIVYVFNISGKASSAPQSPVKGLVNLYLYEWGVVILAIAAVLASNLIVSPFLFKQELLDAIAASPETEQLSSIKASIENQFFTSIYKPYLAYVFYSLGFWIGICLTVTLAILRDLIPDWFELKQTRREIINVCISSEDFKLQEEKLVLIQVHLAIFNAQLRDISEKYIPICFVVIIGLLVESRTAFSESLTSGTLELIKTIAFLFIVLAIIATFFLVIEHQRMIKVIDQYLDKSLKWWLSRGDLAGDIDLVEPYSSMRQDLALSQNSLDFFLSTVKSASFLIPLLMAVLFYLIDSIAAEDWTFLIPEPLLDMLQTLYGTET